jgi:two-component system NtrC family sensor kinase
MDAAKIFPIEEVQADDRLVRSNRLASMGLLAASVAHEINNSLYFIFANLDSLIEDIPELIDAVGRFRDFASKELEAEQRDRIMGRSAHLFTPEAMRDIVERLSDAITGAERVREIARGLSSFSRVEQDERCLLDLNQVVDSAVHMAAGEIRGRAALITEYGELPDVMGSDSRLRQVFLNLLVNAAHAVDGGDPAGSKITVRTWQDGDAACVAVGDNGSGIAEGLLRKIFEPFFTTKASQNGSGLGLAISRKIIVGHGGVIDVQSQVGVGTIFTVRLPGTIDSPMVS